MTGAAVRGVKVAAKATLGVADLATGRFPGPRILIYHQVGASLGREMEVAMDTFERHIALLRSGFRVVDLDTAIRSRGHPGSSRLAVITFDDGYADVYANAFPVLREARLPFTLYLTTSPVETGEPLGHPQAPPLTWEQVREMLDTRLVTIGAHTHTHPDLRHLASPEIARELDQSNALIERRLGIAPRHFAYPWGYWSAAADSPVRARYESATLGAGSPVIEGADPWLLHRLPVQRTDGVALLRLRLRGGGRLEERVRRRVRRYSGP